MIMSSDTPLLTCSVLMDEQCGLAGILDDHEQSDGGGPQCGARIPRMPVLRRPPLAVTGSYPLPGQGLASIAAAWEEACQHERQTREPLHRDAHGSVPYRRNGDHSRRPANA